jgi:hypothetical protein
MLHRGHIGDDHVQRPWLLKSPRMPANNVSQQKNRRLCHS